MIVDFATLCYIWRVIDTLSSNLFYGWAASAGLFFVIFVVIVDE